MITGTGLPQNLADLGNTVLRGPILVQITAITEIGHSAFSLQNVRQARLERADMAGLAGGDDDDEEGPIPRYPRSMLRFQLSDGSTILQAIEHRRLPELELGETPLGYKVSTDHSSLTCTLLPRAFHALASRIWHMRLAACNQCSMHTRVTTIQWPAFIFFVAPLVFTRDRSLDDPQRRLCP